MMLYRCGVFGAACLTVLALVSGAAVAGDTASRHMFGFSADARWFAFEEFGVQDGSGFPYSNIYLIDTKRDRWAPGTPVRVRIDDEKATVATASARARRSAKAKLDQYGIRVPGRLLASAPLNELNGSDGNGTTKTTFQPGFPYGPQFTLHLKTFEGKKSSKCFQDDRPLGLVLEAQVYDGARTVLYRDTSVPKSRGCPLAYAISDVYQAPDSAAEGVTMVLLYVRTIGFEGKDSRFLAIPVRLPTVK